MAEQVPRRLVFFTPGTAPKRRRRRILFVMILLATTLSLIWPVYPVFSRTFPLVLGLPLSLAWVVLWLVVMFVSLIWLFRAE